MNRYIYQSAIDKDAGDIKRIYDLNVEKLHGVIRTVEEWENIIDSSYCVVRSNGVICGWFRIDK